MRFLKLILVATVLGYLGSGFYIVRGNEQALVRWFGRASPQLLSSGLRYALPWPFCRIDRVNLNETRTVTVGLGDMDEVDDSDFLKPPVASRVSEYLTGDNNVLLMQISVQFRIDNPRQFLLEQENPERHLKFLIQSLVADAVSRSGVDYVHPLGLTALRQLLTQEARRAVEEQKLGVWVEDVTLTDVRPPVPVKQAFLDVSNARAEKDRLISEARTTAERLEAQATAQASQLQDIAETERARQMSQALADANRFNALIDQFASGTSIGSPEYVKSQKLSQQRLYWTTLESLLPKLSRNVYLGSNKTVDLTIQRDRRPATRP